MLGIVSLGIGANYALPEARVPAPWTVFLLIITGALASSFFAFTGAAKYSSPALVAENIRLSRFPQPIRFASDGKIAWGAVPVKGWTFLRTFVNSGGNPGIAIVPASMLEQDSDYYTVARCKLYHLKPRAVQVLMRKRTFGKLLTDLGYSEAKKMEVYFGFQSSTLHPDATHIRSPMDLSAYALSLSTDEKEYTRISLELGNQMNRQLELWQRIQGSGPARIVVQREEREEE
jgi:hypothetical protein